MSRRRGRKIVRDEVEEDEEDEEEDEGEEENEGEEDGVEMDEVEEVALERELQYDFL